MIELTKVNKKVEEYYGQMSFDIKIIVEETDDRYTAYLRIGSDGTTNFLYSAPKEFAGSKKAFVETVSKMICVRTIVNYFWWLQDDDDDECDD